MTHGSTFSGIGGFDLAARWCGWENLFQVEIDPYCRAVLAKNFPETRRHEDIKKFRTRRYRGRVDVISGGFPCQPYSTAGQRRGASDDRALWPEMRRVVREIKPRWVVGENVAGIVGMALNEVLSDLESIGYQTAAFIIPAVAVNALHRRDRVWIVAHADGHAQSPGYGQGSQRRGGNANDVEQADLQSGDRPKNASRAGASGGVFAANPNGRGHEQPGRLVGEVRGRLEHGGPQPCAPKIWQPADVADVLRVAYGLPAGLDGIGKLPSVAPAKKAGRGHRMKALGNAIVPQVAFEIFRAINTIEGYQ